MRGPAILAAPAFFILGWCIAAPVIACLAAGADPVWLAALVAGGAVLAAAITRRAKRLAQARPAVELPSTRPWIPPRDGEPAYRADGGVPRECPRCGGRGDVRRRWTWRRERCAMCSGSGRVVEVVTPRRGLELRVPATAELSVTVMFPTRNLTAAEVRRCIEERIEAERRR
jgi:hypothetical protein